MTLTLKIHRYEISDICPFALYTQTTENISIKRGKYSYCVGTPHFYSVDGQMSTVKVRVSVVGVGESAL